MNMPSWIDNYVSIPYMEVNCWGLVVLIYKEMYGLDLTDKEDQGELIREGFWIEVKDDVRTGDVILFKRDKGAHVGLLIDANYMIHADEVCGSVIERWTARNWIHSVNGIYRCKQIA